MPDKVAVVIQARMGSRRLPGKILMPLAGAPMLHRLVERASRATCLDTLIVATTAEVKDDPVQEMCSARGYNCYRGSEDDVLARMIGAAGQSDIVVRLTGDNPFVDGSLIDRVVQGLLDAGPDCVYASNIQQSGYPYGLYVEVARMDALKRGLESSDPKDHEHVTWHIRQAPDTYTQVTIVSDIVFAVPSLTIDTPEDYQLLAPVFDKLYNRNPAFGMSDIAGLNADYTFITGE
jgi:spore coat polysaccharide biosynthesis protein SpsF